LTHVVGRYYISQWRTRGGGGAEHSQKSRETFNSIGENTGDNTPSST